MSRKIIACLLALLIVMMGSVTLIAQDADNQGEFFSATLTYEGIERNYTVYLPPGYDGETALPLVLGLHGAGGDGAQMANASGFTTLASQTNTIVVYPDGVDNFWRYLNVPIDNAGADNLDVDDVGFLTTLLDTVQAEYAVDANRVSVIGYSNGGLMAQTLRCVLDDRLASVAIVGSIATYRLAESCLGAAALPLMIVLGTEDATFQQGGSAVIDDGVLYSQFSHAQTLRFYATLNGCDADGAIGYIGAEGSQHDVAFQLPNNCPEDAPVYMYSIIGAGHEWPTQVAIQIREDFSINLLVGIWEFVRSFELSGDVE